MTDEYLELAILEHAGRAHILVPVGKLPHKIDTAQAQCGIVGRFGPVKYMKPNRAALPRNRDNICEKCFTALARKGLEKYAVDAPCLMHPVLMWLRLVPKGKTRKELEYLASKTREGWRDLEWLKAKSAEVV